jgi:hypothetical protein
MLQLKEEFSSKELYPCLLDIRWDHVSSFGVTGVLVKSNQLLQNLTTFRIFHFSINLQTDFLRFKSYDSFQDHSEGGECLGKGFQASIGLLELSVH